MAFTVEDGTGLTNSNSYVSVAEFQAYWLDRGVDMTQYQPDVKQAALIVSSDHVDVFYGPYMLGYKLTAEQAMQFPRHCLYDSNWYLVEGVPTKLKNAVCEYAKRVIDDIALSPDPTTDGSGQQIQSLYKRVGPIERRTVYFGSSPRSIPAFPKADAMLKEYVFGMGGGSYRA